MDYTIIRSRRKTISLQITPQGALVVRCPNRMKQSEIDAFVKSKERWILSHLPKEPLTPPLSPEERKSLTEAARKDLTERVAFFGPKVGVTVGRIAIRSQRTRWGSCSAKGNLNFNCLLMLAPAEVRDYVVVHELCHRKEMNHSPRFWAQVEAILPNYRAPRNWLKENGSALIARLP